MGEEWLTLQEAVDRLKLHPDTLRRWLRAGTLRGTRLSRKGGWRIPSSEVERVLRGEVRADQSENDAKKA